jgi:hypothetical protein
MTALSVQHRIAFAFKLPPKLSGLLTSLYTADLIPHADRVVVFRLRKEMASYGISIKARPRVGYWLPDECKLMVQEAIGAGA